MTFLDFYFRSMVVACWLVVAVVTSIAVYGEAYDAVLGPHLVQGAVFSFGMYVSVILLLRGSR